MQGIHVTADYFAMFGAPFIAGRGFTAAEDSPNGGHVVVLSYGLWQTRFGGKPDMVGGTIQLDGQPYLVVGIVGKGFVTEPAGDLWIPFQFDLTSQDMANYSPGRRYTLKPGVTIATGDRTRLKLAVDQFPPALIPERTLCLAGRPAFASLQEWLVGDTRHPLCSSCLGQSGFCVFLIACANVANLLLARASARKRELATRAALGAGRGQIIRQLLTESLALSLTGGLLGLILGFAGVRLLLAVSPGGLPRIGEDGSAVTLDLNVLLFTLGVSLVTGILFGLVPAISASLPNIAAMLNEGGSRSGIGFRGGKLRSVLVISEMSLALVLVIGAALLIRTFLKLESVDPGFETHNVLTMTMSIGGDRFP